MHLKVHWYILGKVGKAGYHRELIYLAMLHMPDSIYSPSPDRTLVMGSIIFISGVFSHNSNCGTE